MNLEIFCLYCIVVALTILFQSFGLTYTAQQVGSTVIRQRTADIVFQIIQIVLIIYYFIVLGLLCGTVADKQYGPNLLDKKSQEADVIIDKAQGAVTYE